MAIKKQAIKAPQKKASDSDRFAQFVGVGSDESILDIKAKRDLQTLAESKNYEVKQVKLTSLIDNTSNPFIVADVEYLKESLKEKGLLQPLVVIKQKDKDGNETGKYEIKAGSRRYKAIREIYSEAVANNDEALIGRFERVNAVILPLGATEEEINETVTETNLTARQISADDVFRNFDYIFKTDDQGNFVNIRNTRQIVDAQEVLKWMGFDLKATTIKYYKAIYFCPNQKFKQWVVDGELSYNLARELVSFPEDVQNVFCGEFERLTKPDEKKKYAKKFVKEEIEKRKEKKANKSLTSVEVLKYLEDTRTKLGKMNEKNEALKKVDDEFKKQFNRQILAIEKQLESLKNAIK